MSNYVQTTFFTPKDSLPPTNPAKTIFGAAYDVEFGNIATAISSKQDAIISGPIAFTLGTISAPGVTFIGHTGTGLYSNSNGDLGLTANGLGPILISGTTGATTFAAPSSGTFALSVGAASNWLLLNYAGNTAATTSSIRTDAPDGLGRASIDFVTTTSGSGSNSQINFVTNNFGVARATRLSIAPTGVVTVNVPDTGVAFNVSGASGQDCSHFAPASGQSGIVIFGATGDGARITLGDGHGGIGTGEYWQLRSGGVATGAFDIFDLSAATSRLSITNIGNVAIGAPSSGATLSVSAAASGEGLIVFGNNNAYAADIRSGSTASQAFGLLVLGGTNTNDFAVKVLNAANTTTFFSVNGAGVTSVNPPGGSFSGLLLQPFNLVAQPTNVDTGECLVLINSASANADKRVFSLGTFSGNAFIRALGNGAGGNAPLDLESSAGVIVGGSVTGGAQGAGTLNAGGLFVNGVAVSTAVTSTGTFTFTSPTGATGTGKYTKIGTGVICSFTAITAAVAAGTSRNYTGLPAAIQVTSTWNGPTSFGFTDGAAVRQTADYTINGSTISFRLNGNATAWTSGANWAANGLVLYWDTN